PTNHVIGVIPDQGNLLVGRGKGKVIERTPHRTHRSTLGIITQHPIDHNKVFVERIKHSAYSLQSVIGVFAIPDEHLVVVVITDQHFYFIRSRRSDYCRIRKGYSIGRIDDSIAIYVTPANVPYR